MKTPVTAQEVAKYFLALVDEDAGDSISNLKLQKLVYYAQGLYLALHDASLFPERIEAWAHGPVVPDLYHAYKQHRGEPITLTEPIDLASYSESVRDVLDEVWAVYGQFSASKLRTMSHNEPPFRSVEIGDVISNDAIRAYFKSQLIEESPQAR
jgi:uncharacterized phage-associated protein